MKAIAKYRTHRIGARLTALALAVGLSAAGGIATAAAASAAAWDCPVGYACAWESGGYTTARSGTAHISFFQCQHDFSLRNYAGTSINADNSASSVHNRGQYETVIFYTGVNYTGLPFAFAVSGGDTNLAIGGPAGANDQISSGKFAGASNTCR